MSGEAKAISAAISRRREQGVVAAVGVERVERVRVGEPGEGERDPEISALDALAEPPADHEQQADDDEVEEDRGGVRGGE